MDEDGRIDDDKLVVRHTAGSRTGSYREGEYIFREGELGDLAFVVLSGKVEITRQLDNKSVSIGIIS